MEYSMATTATIAHPNGSRISDGNAAMQARKKADTVPHLIAVHAILFLIMTSAIRLDPDIAAGPFPERDDHSD